MYWGMGGLPGGGGGATAACMRAAVLKGHTRRKPVKPMAGGAIFADAASSAAGRKAARRFRQLSAWFTSSSRAASKAPPSMSTSGRRRIRTYLPLSCDLPKTAPFSLKFEVGPAFDGRFADFGYHGDFVFIGGDENRDAVHIERDCIIFGVNTFHAMTRGEVGNELFEFHVFLNECKEDFLQTVC